MLYVTAWEKLHYRLTTISTNNEVEQTEHIHKNLQVHARKMKAEIVLSN